MRILVTGVTGFIGTHLVARLLEQCHEVFSLQCYVTGRYSTKAAKVLGWHPTVTLEEGLSLIVIHWRQKISGSFSETAIREASA